MTARKYSLDEIDKMRGALRTLCIHLEVPYLPKEKNAEIEDQLRTYMLNGTDPDELKEHATKKRLAESQRLDALHKATTS